MGQEIYDKFWGPLLRGKFGEQADQVSMTWLWGKIKVRGSSRQGASAKEKLAYAGNNIKREDLEVLSLEEINKSMKNREGIDRKNVNVAPRASIPFAIVFENLPENMSQYGGEVVSSSLGGP